MQDLVIFVCNKNLNSKKCGKSISRILLAIMPNDHSSSPIITNRVKRPTRIVNWEMLKKKFQTIPIWSFSWWGLQCLSCCQVSGKLLPHHFTLTQKIERYIFCCAIPQVTLAGS